MSRHKDYQPTIDRQRVQNTDLKRMLAEQRRVVKDALRDNSHMRFALQDADAENDRLRLALLVQDSIVEGLRADLAEAHAKITLYERQVVVISTPGDMNWFRERWSAVSRRVLPALFPAPPESI